MDKVFNSYLEKIYYQPQSPGSFTSRDKIWRFIRSRRDKPKGLTLKIVEQWLQLQDTPSVYKSRGSKFKREKIIVSCRDEQWSADLMDTSKLKKENDNVTFILVIVDIFSKFYRFNSRTICHFNGSIDRFIFTIFNSMSKVTTLITLCIK